VANAKTALAFVRTLVDAQLDKNEGLSPAQLQAAKEMLADVLVVVEKTLDLKKLDSAASVVLKPGASPC